MLTLTSREMNDVLVFMAEQALEEDDTTSQREWLYKTIESRQDGRFAVDLGEIDYLSSAEIGFLITLKRRIDARKGKLVLFQVDPFIVDIFRTMRLDKLFVFAGDLDEAVAKLRG
jgi:anti-sigma B factor antagonist